VAVNLGLQDGDESLRLVEGTQRFTFTEANWDRPFAAVVQLDRNLDGPTAATFRATSGNIPLAWSISFFVLSGVFLALMAWHAFALPRPASDRPTEGAAGGDLLQYLAFLALFIPLLVVLLVPMSIAGVVAPRTTGPWGRMFRALPFSGTPFAETITSFFEKPEIGIAIAFVLFYRFAEGQVVKLVTPFLLDSVEAGGLALTTGEVGLVYGTIGVAALTVGGILGGIVAARDGLGRWLWPMVIAINLPNAMYLLLAVIRPEGLWLVSGAVAVEQFGYGFGFAAFLLVLIYIAEGEHKTAHYAIGTGLMALGMMIPGMFSGWLEDILGYETFFWWVLIATIPSFLVTARIRIDPEFGKKKDEPAETAQPSPPNAATGDADDAFHG
jgi:PAT family beta-lactamase induction signal transducer AmpG